MNTETIGFVAAILTTAAFVPQAYKVYKSGKSDDLSLMMFVIFTIGVALWLVYGALIANTPIIVANAVTLVLSGYILVKKLRS